MCTADDHAELKQDRARLLTETVGYEPQRAADGSVLVYLRTCRRCGSTLCLEDDPET